MGLNRSTAASTLRRRATLRWWTLLPAVMTLGTCVEAQSSRAPVPDAVMLKRIAEAVDGNRSGKQVYVVLSGEPLNPPVGVFSDLKEANAQLTAAGKGAQLFGPYQTALDPGGNIAACVHVTGSRWQTDRCVPPVRTVRQDDVRSLSLVITRLDGTRDSIPLPPNADAVFLSLASIDKFVVPYYARMLGLPAVTAMRQEAERSFAATGAQKRE